MDRFCERLLRGSWLVLLAAVVSACPGDGVLNPNGNPNDTVPTPSAATLSGDVQPIFTQNCAFSGCHAGTSPAASQDLSSGQAFASVVNTPSIEVPSLLRVTPGDPDSSYLVQKIEGTAAVGLRMPIGGQLTSQQIETIRSWITDGAQDN